MDKVVITDPAAALAQARDGRAVVPPAGSGATAAVPATGSGATAAGAPPAVLVAGGDAAAVGAAVAALRAAGAEAAGWVGDPSDDGAREMAAELFPGRDVEVRL